MKKVIQEALFGSMRNQDHELHDYLVTLLYKKGHPTLAALLKHIPLYAVEYDEDGELVSAAFYPEKKCIIVNPNVEPKEEGLLFLIRHEMSHKIQQHHEKLEKKYGTANVDREYGKTATIIRKGDKLELVMIQIPKVNCAADMDLSNQFYSKRDKQLTSKELKISGQIWKGIVSEELFPDNPDIQDMTYYELLDYLEPMSDEAPLPEDDGSEGKKRVVIEGTYEDETTFIDTDGNFVVFDDEDPDENTVTYYHHITSEPRNWYRYNKETEKLEEIKRKPPKEQDYVFGTYEDETTFIDTYGKEADFSKKDPFKTIYVHVTSRPIVWYAYNPFTGKLVEIKTGGNPPPGVERDIVQGRMREDGVFVDLDGNVVEY